MQCLFHFYFFKWAILDLFFVYFHLFKQISQFLQQIIVKKCPSNIRCWDSNPQPLKHESPPITTRPTDVTILIRRYINLLIKRIHFKFLTSQVFAARTSFLTFLISLSRLSKELKHFDQTQMCTSCWIRSINSFITIFTLNLPHDDGELLFVSSLLCSESDQLLKQKRKKGLFEQRFGTYFFSTQCNLEPMSMLCRSKELQWVKTRHMTCNIQSDYFISA